jgi:hypothetical protein
MGRACAAACLEPFDPLYREQCGDGWAKRYFYDYLAGACASFWWAGCTSPNMNMFLDRQQCERMCMQRAMGVR